MPYSGGGDVPDSLGPLTDVTVGTTTTAGTATTVIDDTMAGGSATDNFFNCTGTYPQASSGIAQTGALYSFTMGGSAGGDANAYGIQSVVTGATSWNQGKAAVWASNTISAGGTNTGLTGGAAGNEHNKGLFGTAITAGPVSNVGTWGEAGNATSNYGVVGNAYSGSTTDIGVWGALFSSTATSRAGGYFALDTTVLAGVAALSASNGAVAADLLHLRDNTTLVYSVVDGGQVRDTQGSLALNADYTNATATFSNTALSANVTSGRTYAFEVALMLSQSTAADGVKIDFNGGGATATNFRVSGVLTNDVGAIVTQAAATSTSLAGVLNATATVTTAQHLYKFSGTFTPSSSSTFIVRAACNADTTGTLTIHRGSWLQIRDANAL